MTTNHIDQLTQWWENAEPGIPGAGDTVIFDERHRSLGFHVTQASTDHPRGYDNARILHRAPKPKPAWHDAVAVIAHIGGNELPRVLVRDNDGAFVDGLTGSAYVADRLRDVTPLIEAKVTDEMVGRIRELEDDYGRKYFASHLAARELLTAALGLDPA